MYKLPLGYEHLNTGVELTGLGPFSFWRESPSIVGAWSHQPFTATWRTISNVTGAVKVLTLQAQHTTEEMPSTPYTDGHIREIARASLALNSRSVVDLLEAMSPNRICWCDVGSMPDMMRVDIGAQHRPHCRRATEFYRELGGINLEGAR